MQVTCYGDALSVNMYLLGYYLVVLLTVVVTVRAGRNVRAKDLKVTLPSGDKMSMIGFGTGGIKGVKTMTNILDDALNAGYRLIDAAAFYENEEDIGIALKELLPKHHLTRNDIFITSKLAPKKDLFGEHAYEALKQAIQRFGTDYIDLYLIHFPGYFPLPEPNMNFSALRDETWKQLVKGQKEGLVRNIGVSNYNIRQLKELLRNDHGVKPAINQVEWHPDYHQDELLKFCKKQGVALQAYFSLGGVNNKTVLLEKPEVKQIAIKLRKSPSQVLLKWALQQNILVVPGSRTRKHMDQNLDLNFKIPEADMKILNNLKQAGRISMFPDIII